MSVMLDPSLFLSRETLYKLPKVLEENRAWGPFWIAEAFENYIDEGYGDDSAMFRFYVEQERRTKDRCAYPSLDYIFDTINELKSKELLESFPLGGRGGVNGGVSPFPTEMERAVHEAIGRTADRFDKKGWYGTEYLSSVLQDQWEFLNTQSAIVSASKKTFQAFKKGGAAVIEFGSKLNLNALVGKTIKHKGDDPIELAHQFRALCKWVAVGGPAVAPIYVTPELAQMAAAAGGMFMLVDP